MENSRFEDTGDQFPDVEISKGRWVIRIGCLNYGLRDREIALGEDMSLEVAADMFK
jgi:hypothetical protein